MQNLDRIKKVFAGTFGIPESDIKETTSQQNFARWDSLMHLNLIIALESEFGISFEPDEIVAMNSVKTIAEVINSRI